MVKRSVGIQHEDPQKDCPYVVTMDLIKISGTFNSLKLDKEILE